MQLPTSTARDNTVHLEQCVAVAGLSGCTCRQIEAEALPEPGQIKQQLLDHLQAELEKAEGWVTKNKHEGFPEAAESWLPKVKLFQQYIAFVESAPAESPAS